jgi:hypothetical protein
VNLGQLAPYVAKSDHGGVELDLPLAPSGGTPWWVWAWPFFCFGLTGWCAWEVSPVLSLGIWGLSLLGVVGAVYFREPSRVRLRLERHRLVLRDKTLSTSELSRIDTSDTSLVLHYADGTSEWLELSLEPPHLLEELARILRQHAAEDRLTSALPAALQQLRSQMPEQG